MGGMSRGLGIRLGPPPGGASAPASPTFAMVNGANTSIVDQGSSEYLITMNGGTDGAWGTSSARSTTPLTGDFILRIIPQQINKNMMIGINTDPTTDNTFSGLDYAIYFDAAAANRWENGSAVSTVKNPFAAFDTFFIKRAGTTLTFGYGGTDGVTGFTAVTTGTNAATFYFDSAFLNTGGAVAVKRLA